MQAAGHTDDGAQGDSSVGVKPSTANIIIIESIELPCFSHSYMIHLGFQVGVDHNKYHYFSEYKVGTSTKCRPETGEEEPLTHDEAVEPENDTKDEDLEEQEFEDEHPKKGTYKERIISFQLKLQSNLHDLY